MYLSTIRSTFQLPSNFLYPENQTKFEHFLKTYLFTNQQENDSDLGLTLTPVRVGIGIVFG